MTWHGGTVPGVDKGNSRTTKLPYHLKASQRKVSQLSILQYCVLRWETVDGDLIVQDDGLGALDVAKGGHREHHPAVVIGITTNL